MKKYLFLDIDGVLHTGKDCRARASKGIPTEDGYGSLFAEEAVRALGRIVEQADPEIIVSSTWKEFGLAWLNNMWTARRLPGRISSVTPSLIATNYTDPVTGENFMLPERAAKGLEVNAWLEEHGERVCCYAILDDEADCFLLSQAGHLVLTDGEEGLTKEKANQTIQLLNGTTE